LRYLDPDVLGMVLLLSFAIVVGAVLATAARVRTWWRERNGGPHFRAGDELSTQEVAKQFGISVEEAWCLMLEGVIPSKVISGGARTALWDDVERLKRGLDERFPSEAS
jgi:hypothetical protein